MYLLPIVTFGLLFVALTNHLLGKSVNSTAQESNQTGSSKDGEPSIVIETDSPPKLLVKLNPEKEKTH